MTSVDLDALPDAVLVIDGADRGHLIATSVLGRGSRFRFTPPTGGFGRERRDPERIGDGPA